eukprot:TRINITY_DN58876_c0_g1_i1.p1 TRINITY_DN58876_c0_g1~~TRINITY_DN58876_c0_g1_i1.p1  ORF type:complete len:1535 (+),score=293.91 TRINITY_DN58876_c0_g1_i1:252-4607(+)
MDAYKDIVADFAKELRVGTKAWVAVESGHYEKGYINRVNAEDTSAITYDFQYAKQVMDNGKTVEKIFVVKDLPRIVLCTRHVLVKGDPAGGKTTFAKQLLTWIMRQPDMTWLVPVMVRTIDLVRCRDQLVVEHGSDDIVDQYLMMRYAASGSYMLFKHARSQGRLLVILDGFDEAGLLENALIRQMREVLVNSCFVVLTSRDMGSTLEGPAFERFRSVRVKELNEEQQLEVIRRRLENGQVNNFCMHLKLNPALSQMARNPLLLNVTLTVFESCCLSREKTELNRGKVYSMALDGMLSNLEQAKSCDSGACDETTEAESATLISASDLRIVLRQLAYLAHTYGNGQGIRDFKADLIRRAVESSGLGDGFTMEHWKHVEDRVKKGRLPLLAWFAEGETDTFRFAHLTFQEFLCAEQCLQRSLQNEDFIFEWRDLVCPDSPAQMFTRGWWQQTLQMYCDLATSSGAKTRSGRDLDTFVGEVFLRLGEGHEDQSTALQFSRVNDSNVLTLASMLRCSDLLQDLELQGGLGSPGCVALEGLELCRLRRLRLSHNEIGPAGCKSIAAFMESGRAPLEELDLANNIICQGEPKKEMPPPSSRNPRTGHYDSYLKDLQGLRSLLEVICKSNTLRTLDIRGNFLDLEAGRLLVDAVLANESLEAVSGVPITKLRSGELTELEFVNRPFFTTAPAERFFATGDALLLVEMLLRFPQPGLCKLVLANQALASDAEGVVTVFEKLGEVVAAAAELEHLSLEGYWDCGAAAGVALGEKVRSHRKLCRLQIGTDELDLAKLRREGTGTHCEVEELNFSNTDRRRGIRDCGAGILSKCLPPSVRKLKLQGAGVGATGYKILSGCKHVEDINGILLGDFTTECVSLDFSTEPFQSAGAVACVIARTTLTPNLTHLNLSGSNLTSKSHVHVLSPVIGGSPGVGCDGGCDCSAFRGTNAYRKCAQCDLDFCSTCCMSECPMVALADALQRLPCLVSLRIANCAFQGGRHGPIRSHKDEASYEALGASLSKHENITELDISDNYFTGPGFPHLAKHVAKMASLRTLKIGQSPVDFAKWLTADTIKPGADAHSAELLVLAHAIARNSGLRRLDFSECGRTLSHDIVYVLVESLRAAGQNASATGRLPLETLALQDFVIPVASLQDGILTNLDVSDDCAQHHVLAPLFELMVDIGSALTEINFSRQQFGGFEDTVVSAVLSKADSGALKTYNGIQLQPPPEMDALDLQDKPVMSHGICVMASTIIPRGNITSLNLGHCGLNSHSLRSLLAAMRSKPTVTSLDISRQYISPEGLQELANFLRVDKKLQVLRARKIGARGQELLELSSALEINLSLVTLDLRENPLHELAVKKLKRTMEEKRSIVPMAAELKYMFLLCNQHLPCRMRLPDAQCTEVSRLFSDGACSPVPLIFQYAAQARELILSDSENNRPSSRDNVSDSDFESDGDVSNDSF